jgi:HD superfamily phosphohydrolase
MQSIGKSFSDNIHGIIELSPTAVQIIDTPEFQRLRNIKQLASAVSVFQNATHSRFEHSIGVAFLAKKFITHLMVQQPELRITQHDILLAEVAGLCHDLGHGPFSHVFDNEIIKNNDEINEKMREHEERSILIMTYIIRKYNIVELSSTDILKNLSNMIIPPKNHNNFKWDIVCNKKNGIDVDRFDYLLRDMTNLGMKSSFDYNRLLKTARVIDNEICFPQKEALNIYEMYHMRFTLHKQLCNHPVVKSIEFMITDIIKHINERIMPLAKEVNILHNFIRLNDTNLIELAYKDPRANELYTRILTRDIYKLVITIQTGDLQKDLEELNKLFKYEEMAPDIKNKLKNNYEIQKMQLSLSGDNKHPMTDIKFYNKTNLAISYTLKLNEIGMIVPHTNNESCIRIFAKTKESYRIIKDIY